MPPSDVSLGLDSNVVGWVILGNCDYFHIKPVGDSSTNGVYNSWFCAEEIESILSVVM